MRSKSQNHSTRPSVIVADDDPEVLHQIRCLLETEYDVVSVVADGQALIEGVESLGPDVVVADITMPRVDGLRATEELARRCSEIPVVILSVHDEPGYVEAAHDAGALAYVIKRCASSDLIPAIRSVLSGKRYLSPGLADGS